MAERVVGVGLIGGGLMGREFASAAARLVVGWSSSRNATTGADEAARSAMIWVPVFVTQASASIPRSTAPQVIGERRLPRQSVSRMKAYQPIPSTGRNTANLIPLNSSALT